MLAKFRVYISQLINLLIDEEGEILGEHKWDDEYIFETGGDFIFARVSINPPLVQRSRLTSFGPEFQSSRICLSAGGAIRRHHICEHRGQVDRRVR